MIPTPEQQEIIKAARTTPDNLLINALAGSAKTTTLEMICKAVTGTPILSLQFNKRVADEAKKRMPPHVECKTLNALGHHVWSGAIGKRLIVDADKMRKICRQLIEEVPRRSQSELWESLSDTLLWLRRAKRDGFSEHPSAKSLIDYDEWIENYGEAPEQPSLFMNALQRSTLQALNGLIDFDDQLYMPVLFGGSWPKFPLVMCDEVQDLSPINHTMLTKLVSRRLIAVGDPWQSIYGFRGAVSNGMSALKKRFSMRELTLSVTFRVPIEGVKRAWFRVPHMKWCDWAQPGSIQSLDEWSPDSIKDNSAIICRNNAPLFSAALKLIRAGRNIKLVGMEIGPGLIRTMKKLGPETMNEKQMLDAIARWRSAELLKAKKEEVVWEKAECLEVLCAGRTSLQEAILFAEQLFKREGPIQLLSGHKAKGLEWETVYHLDPWRIPSKWTKEGTEEFEQEMNIRYVIETRFKQELFLMNMEGFHA